MSRSSSPPAPRRSVARRWLDRVRPADLVTRFASHTEFILADDYTPVDTLLRPALDDR